MFVRIIIEPIIRMISRLLDYIDECEWKRMVWTLFFPKDLIWCETYRGVQYTCMNASCIGRNK